MQSEGPGHVDVARLESLASGCEKDKQETLAAQEKVTTTTLSLGGMCVCEGGRGRVTLACVTQVEKYSISKRSLKDECCVGERCNNACNKENS